jgi:hypothetical protein
MTDSPAASRDPRIAAVALVGAPARASRVSGWPRRCELAHASLLERSGKRLELAQLLSQLGVFLTPPVLKPPLRAVKRPARPDKSATQNRFTVENAKGAQNAPGGPGQWPAVRRQTVCAICWSLTSAIWCHVSIAGIDADLGFGRIVVSDTDVPNILANLV